jgi:hypothetical protein
VNNRRLVVWALVAVLAAITAGCGPGQTEPPPLETATPMPLPTQGGTMGGQPTAGPATEGVRTAVLVAARGTVEARHYPGGTLEDALPGRSVATGDEVRTGLDGTAVIRMDDGTVVVVPGNSSVVAATLAGSAQQPTVRLFLNVGWVYILRETPVSGEGSIVVETAAGLASFLGQAMSVGYDQGTGRMVATCLAGPCRLSAGGQSVDLEPGDQAEIAGAGQSPGAPVLMDGDLVELWVAALAYLEEVGAGVEIDDGGITGPYGPYGPYGQPRN